MKQLLQNLSNGETKIVESPAPKASIGNIIVETKKSLISAGTERMLVEFGHSNFLSKAQQQPEKVKLVLEKMKTDGILSTVNAVKSKLNQPIALGYSNVGIVSEVAKEINDFHVGDRVVSNGRHAEVVKVQKNLCASIPDNVTDETASFTVISSIALQGVRLANPTLGEYFVVIGAGLIGLITVQLLKAHGINVLAIDLDDKKLELAKKFGAEVYNALDELNVIPSVISFSKGEGADGVIITAATSSNQPIKNAAQMSRKRGRIILVGVAGLNIDRSDFYKKELSFQVSCSYGPGRYDPNYEEKGIDYPIGFVRWTEKRNFIAVLEMMSNRSLITEDLVSHRYGFNQASNAYDTLRADKNVLGILLEYETNVAHKLISRVKISSPKNYNSKDPIVSFIGAGNYASRVLIPAFKSSGAQLHTIATEGGINGVFHGKRFGFIETSTDIDHTIENSKYNTIVIATRHDTHARFIIKGLNNGKNIFVEKPLAISQAELKEIKIAFSEMQNRELKSRLMVGFNRRFSPLVKKVKQLLSADNGPKSFIMTMNAGFIPKDHWVQDRKVGGGRIIGEACHYIDLMRYLANSPIVSIKARKMEWPNSKEIMEDKTIITLSFKDGSLGSINYFANGHKSFSKERIEVFSSGKILQIDNFRVLKAFGYKGFSKKKLFRQNKGQIECSSEFLNSIKKGIASPIPINEIFEVAEATLEVVSQLDSQ